MLRRFNNGREKTLWKESISNEVCFVQISDLDTYNFFLFISIYISYEFFVRSLRWNEPFTITIKSSNTFVLVYNRWVDFMGKVKTHQRFGRNSTVLYVFSRQLTGLMAKLTQNVNIEQKNTCVILWNRTNAQKHGIQKSKFSTNAQKHKHIETLFICFVHFFLSSFLSCVYQLFGFFFLVLRCEQICRLLNAIKRRIGNRMKSL